MIATTRRVGAYGLRGPLVEASIGTWTTGKVNRPRLFAALRANFTAIVTA